MAALRDESRWRAVLARDKSSDGSFVFAVSSTGVYCRPSCPAKRPCRKNVRFFRQPQEAERAGYRECMRCRPKSSSANPRQQLVGAICRYIEQHMAEPITLSQLGAHFQHSPFHLQRLFKATLGLTPRQYADSCRMRAFRQKVKSGQSVTRAMHEAGYSSASRLYSRTGSELGMEPSKYRRGAVATVIRYACADSPLGRILLATTNKGICSIQLADSDEELELGLKREFPFAIRRADDELSDLMQKVVERANGLQPSSALPLDIRATAFQRRVWSYLQKIPLGETRSYAAVAKAIRRPSAVRAVAHACATNPAAIAIPCHRVVRSDGSLGGYRWGLERKKVLLEREKTSAQGR